MPVEVRSAVYVRRCIVLSKVGRITCKEARRHGIAPTHRTLSDSWRRYEVHNEYVDLGPACLWDPVNQELPQLV